MRGKSARWYRQPTPDRHATWKLGIDYASIDDASIDDASIDHRVRRMTQQIAVPLPGRDAFRDALHAGVRVNGVTIHLVDSAMDGGPIVLKEAVAIRPSESRDELEARIHTVEHRLLPAAVRLMLGGAVTVADGHAI